jgi:hypothetical protein
MNLCVECGEDFGSLSAFDKHRRGNADERYCLSVSEFENHDLVKNKRGTWSIGKGLKKARELNDISK